MSQYLNATFNLKDLIKILYTIIVEHLFVSSALQLELFYIFIAHAYKNFMKSNNYV